jgi:hypothetical protein
MVLSMIHLKSLFLPLDSSSNYFYELSIKMYTDSFLNVFLLLFTPLSNNSYSTFILTYTPSFIVEYAFLGSFYIYVALNLLFIG